jgi:hypothetical protein
VGLQRDDGRYHCKDKNGSIRSSHHLLLSVEPTSFGASGTKSGVLALKSHNADVC